MDFTALQTEVFSNSFDYLNDAGTGLARVKRWINQSYLEICESYPWPFLEVTVTGVAPYTFTDVRKVVNVVDTVAKSELSFISREELVATVSADLTITGTPSYWYWDADVLRVFPVNAANTLSIRYVKVAAELSAGADVPVVPARFHDLIVVGALRQAYRDDQNLSMVQAVSQEFDDRLLKMAVSLMNRQKQGESVVLLDFENFSQW